MKLHVSDPLLRVRTVNACYLLTASHSHAPSLSPKTRLIPIFLQISGVLHAAAQQFCMCNFFLHQLMQGWKHYHVLVHRCINLLSDALWGSIFRGEGWKEFCHCCVCTQHLELPSLGACLHVLERWWWWWWWGGFRKEAVDSDPDPSPYEKIKTKRKEEKRKAEKCHWKITFTPLQPWRCPAGSMEAGLARVGWLDGEVGWRALKHHSPFLFFPTPSPP